MFRSNLGMLMLVLIDWQSFSINIEKSVRQYQPIRNDYLRKSAFDLVVLLLKPSFHYHDSCV